VTPDRWDDFAAVMGPRGAYGGCWCMFWRMKRSDFSAGQGEPNREAMRGVVARGEEPGIIGYDEGKPVGWCAIAPRDETPAIGRSPVLKPVDDAPAVWSITCFYVIRGYRRQGVMMQMIKGAVEHAQSHGARIVESYPTIPKKDTIPDMYAYMGTLKAFEKAGFHEVIRRSATHPVMRFEIE
jgi:GNAT superfamily N-acetyltransferase